MPAVKVEIYSRAKLVYDGCYLVEVTVVPNFKWDPRKNGKFEIFAVTVQNQFTTILNEYVMMTDEQVRKCQPSRYKFFIDSSNNASLSCTIVSTKWNYTCQTNIEFPNRSPGINDTKPDLPYSSYKSVRCNNGLPPASFKIFFKPFECNDLQECVMIDLYWTNKDLLVCSPSGSGKTTASVLAILQELDRTHKAEKRNRSVYIHPSKERIKYLSVKWMENFRQLDPDIRVCHFSSSEDLQLVHQADVIMCSAEIFFKYEKHIDDLALVILDDLHMLEDATFFHTELVATEIGQSKAFRRVVLCETLRNVREISDWLNIRDSFNFSADIRPVPLSVRVESAPGRLKIFETIATIPQSTIAVFFTPVLRERDLEEFLPQLKSFLAENDPMKVYDLKERTCFVYDNQPHEALTEAEKRLEERNIDVLVVSRARCWTVSTTAHVVVITGAQNSVSSYSPAEIRHMAGRAQNSLIDDHPARAFLMCDPA